MDFVVDLGSGFVLKAESEPRAQPASHLRASLTTSEGGDRLVEEGGPGPKNFCSWKKYLKN